MQLQKHSCVILSLLLFSIICVPYVGSCLVLCLEVIDLLHNKHDQDQTNHQEESILVEHFAQRGFHFAMNLQGRREVMEAGKKVFTASLSLEEKR